MRATRTELMTLPRYYDLDTVQMTDHMVPGAGTDYV